MRHGIGISPTLNRAKSALYLPPAGNVVTNWKGTGTGGTNGLPDGWAGFFPAGVTLSVLSRKPYRGGNIIEFQFAGTSTAAGNCAIYACAYTGFAAAPGQVWRNSAFVEPVGSQSPSRMAMTGEWHNSGNAFIAGLPLAALTAATIAAGPTTPADGTAPALTSFVAAPELVLFVGSGVSVNLRCKIFAPTLQRIS